VGCQWIDQLERDLGCTIVHKHYNPETKTLEGREEILPCHKGPVDGWNKETSTAFEFLGDEFHGYPGLWKKERNFLGVPYKYLYQKTLSKFQALRTAGVKVYYIWESDYKKEKSWEEWRNPFKYDLEKTVVLNLS